MPNKILVKLKFFLKTIDQVPDPISNPEILKNIPSWRKEYILKFKNLEDQKRSLGSWLLLTEQLKRLYLNPNLIYKDEKGKLFHPDINFSISHSDNLIFLVFNEKQIGCDIERIKTFPVNINTRFFSSFEKENYRNQKNTNEYLYYLWTGKESYLKMTGQGLINNLDQISIDLKNLRIFKNNILQNCILLNGKVGNYIWSVCKEKRSLN